MKTFLAVTLLLAACSTVPPTPAVPPPVQGPSCTALEDCSSPLMKTAALGPERTVMHMLHSHSTLIGANPAAPEEWPASVYARMQDAACSATLVGERVLFMASHCMPDGGIVTFNVHSNAYTARCSHHPEYATNNTADWTLCLVDRPVTGVTFEILGIGQQLTVGQKLTLSGYGCIRPGGGGGNDGIFRVGLATIQGLPYGKTYDIVTKGGAALCFGDSGGSAYVVSPTGVRYIAAVNSRGDISTMSYLPFVGASTFKNWAITWAAQYNNVKICGVHDDAMGCRSGEATPQADGKFEVSTKSACVRGMVGVSYLPHKQDVVDAVRAALDKFQ